MFRLVLAGLAVLILIRPVLDLIRLIRAEPAARRYWPRMLWARRRWHHLARSTGLAQPEMSARSRPDVETSMLTGWLIGRALGRLVLFTLFVLGAEVAVGPSRLRYPRARRWRLTDYGWNVTVKTTPRTGRKEVDRQAQHLADSWKCQRVGVSQIRPGRLLVRALRADPLAVPFGPERCPADAYTARQPDRLYLGRDDFGQHRWLGLRGVTGICVSGLPGYGKTSLINSWLCQLAPTTACQIALLDGKDGGDQEPWRDRAWRYSGDDLAAAVDVLESVHLEMRRRLSEVRKPGQARNRWNAGGPTPDWPLMLTVLDECQTFLDLASYKGDRVLEPLARRCIYLASQLIRKGRSVLFCTILATQKTTGDSIPTALRDNSALSASFALKTNEASVAALGDGIREFPGYSPTQLQVMPEGIGQAIVTMPTGQDPFTRLRVPEISEEWAAARAASSVPFRRNPLVPDLDLPTDAEVLAATGVA